MSPKERVADFFIKFDSIVREYENAEGSKPLQEEELRSAFFNSTIGANPDLEQYDLNYELQNNSQMPMDKLRYTLLKIEARRNEQKQLQKNTSQNPAANSAQFNNKKSTQHNREFQNKSKAKCKRCYKWGHDCDGTGNCPLWPDKYFCLVCQRYGVTHQGYRECPQADKNRATNNYESGSSDRRRKEKMSRRDKNKDARRGYKPYAHDDRPKANNTGNVIYTNNDSEHITFIADSGATEHIVNKGLILSDFKKCLSRKIKSANKNQKADIKIDGKGDLLLQSHSENKTIKLLNVLAAKDIANNLIPLRKFVDMGLCIQLDNKKIRIFDRDSDQDYLTGNYEKPNWLITLKIINSENPESTQEYENYECTARLVTIEEFLQQSQTDVQELSLSTSEGVKDSENPEEHPSELGRESSKEFIQNCTNDPEIFPDSDLDHLKLNRKIHDLNDSENQLDPESLIKERINSSERSLDKVSNGMLWHRRLGHASLGYLKQLKKTVKEIENVKFEDSIQDCEVCILSKMERSPYHETRTRANRPLYRIHTDIMGPIKPASFPGGNRYIITFVDDYTRYAKIYTLKNKSQAGDCLENFLQRSRNLLGRNEKVCFIRADNARENLGGKFQEVMEREKIDNDFSPPYTPQHNGTAERFNKTLEFKIRSLLIDSGLPLSMWILAGEAAVHIYNRTPHKSNNFGIPLKLFVPDQKLHIDKIRRFGCISYTHIPQPESKLSPRALKTILVGYSNSGYILWHPTSNKFFNSRNARCNEKLVYKDDFKSLSDNSDPDKSVDDSEIIFDETTTQTSETTLTQNQNQQQSEDKSEREKPKRGRKRKQTQSEPEVVPTKIRKQPTRKAKEGRDFTVYAKSADAVNSIEDTSFAFFMPESLNKDEVIFRDIQIEGQTNQNLEEDEMKFSLLATINKDPTSYQEALASPERNYWQSAVDEELQSMEKNEVWKIIDRPTSKKEEKKANIIDSKWVFKKKTGENNKITHKARLVIRGFKDRKEYELKETYAPVSRLPLVRTVLAIANKYDLELCQMDVKTAFLNGKLEENIYMEIPEGVNVDSETRKTKICKLQKSLYGLRISPKRWNQRFTEEVTKLGLKNSVIEPCLYTWRKLGKMATIVLYVDDMLIISNDSEKLKEIKSSLSTVFEMKDLGEPENFLGMKITRNRSRKEILIIQSEYTEKILERFNMKNCSPKNSPMETRQVQNRKTKRAVENSEIQTIRPKRKIPYREAIGSLLYLAGGTRPDIAYAVNVLSRRQVSPTEADWEDVKRLMRYLRGTTNLGLKYTAKSEKLEAKTDSSFCDWLDSTSTSGYIITLFGDPVAWRSHKQTIVTRSTCGAEYLAMSEACQELVSLDKAIRLIIGETLFPFTVWCDNVAACNNTQMEGSHKLKDFDDSLEKIKENLRFRENTGESKTMEKTHGDYVKYLVSEGKVNVEWIPTNDNTADIFTKPLEFRKHQKFTNEILNSEI